MQHRYVNERRIPEPVTGSDMVSALMSYCEEYNVEIEDIVILADKMDADVGHIADAIIICTRHLGDEVDPS
ncbi:hypothetical protein EVB94_164 [Rhizobium phage RHph_TM40]|uniref:Uncharacterized protein n=1 Tax=Rhizobium phage RHph_Y65 TaxID=2509785 RepID=A0A7S5UWU2_9CAUD|nr:hypothetical protein PQC17_gp165 [Rhizobium phage RHph_Y65]QIG71635.1 hypothetical protein EVB94_164 [Rhizobium phage RHph_TM40]QIG72723.1 hypothetical protein EVB97_165 [Rhizobium phage RHph_Y65]QIG77488.1 hypothetical protein EVB61_160 [Rhizobium phage RHph_TM21B]QIG77750.1 hypothetical protein EVB64_163 [Rhizobium phage RHph_TM61]